MAFQHTAPSPLAPCQRIAARRARRKFFSLQVSFRPDLCMVYGFMFTAKKEFQLSTEDRGRLEQLLGSTRVAGGLARRATVIPGTGSPRPDGDPHNFEPQLQLRYLAFLLAVPRRPQVGPSLRRPENRLCEQTR